MSTRKSQSRRGAITVETAVIMPFFIMFTFAVLQFGHAIMIKGTLKNSVRNAARYGTTEEATTAVLKQRLRNGVKSVVNSQLIEIHIKDASVYDTSSPPPITDAELMALPEVKIENLQARQMFLVYAKFNYNDAAILRYPLSGEVYFIGRSFMRRE
jgi:Flp pilus assembly protein TadG